MTDPVVAEEPVEAALQALIDDRGPTLFHDADALERSLLDRCPRAAPDIALLRVALDEQVPQALLSVEGEEERQLLGARLEKRLRDRRGLNAYAAKYAVDAWAGIFEARSGFAGAPASRPVDAPASPAPSKPPVAPGSIIEPTDATSERPTAARVDGPVGSPMPAVPRRGSRGLRYAVVAVVVVGAVAAVAWHQSGEAPRSIAATARVQAGPRLPVVPSPSPSPSLIEPVAPEPVAIRPPVIRFIGVPSGIATGQAYALTIDYRDGDHELASIERRSFDGAGQPLAAVTIAAADLSNAGNGTLRYPIDGSETGGRSLEEFTLIDRDGARSEPKRVILETTPATPPITQPIAATRPAGIAPMQATPQRAAADGCTRATCGSVVMIRERGDRADDARLRSQVSVALGIPIVAPTTRARGSYEVTVLMDDRSLRTVSQSTRPSVGARTRLTGGRLAAIAAGTGKPTTSDGRVLPESVPFVNP